MEITFVQYVLASGSLDNVGPDSPQLIYMEWNRSTGSISGDFNRGYVEAER